jgi:integral membrane protein (TIGR01906 family)
MKDWMKKIFTLKNLFITIFALTVPFIILLDNTKQAIVYEGYSGILNETGAFSRVNNTEEINKQVVGFIIGTNKELDVLTPREREHMEDVRWVVKNGYIIYLTLIILAFASFFILITKYEIKDAANALMIASVISIAKLILLSVIDFTALFTVIHKLIFEEGTWLFSQSDLLIRMYSFDFFQQISKRIVIDTGMQAIILGIFGYLIKNKEYTAQIKKLAAQPIKKH